MWVHRGGGGMCLSGFIGTRPFMSVWRERWDCNFSFYQIKTLRVIYSHGDVTIQTVVILSEVEGSLLLGRGIPHL